MGGLLDLEDGQRPDRLPLRALQGRVSARLESGAQGLHHFPLQPGGVPGVLVKEKDLENTTYRFILEDGSVVEVKGNEEIEYDGETHTAANLFDALKEGYYGKF